MNGHVAYTLLDLTGTFVFAISGAVAARQRRLDLFGVVFVTFIVACGGGIVRDVCIGAVPPAGLSNWRYLLVSMVAAALTVAAYQRVKKLRYPVLLFDAIGLGLFAVAGAQKALAYSESAEVAILLGMFSAVGGGVIRDVLLSRVPAILQREIYALAALFGATVEVVSLRTNWLPTLAPWLAIGSCVAIRLSSLYFGWRLPTFGNRQRDGR
ncbi:trimeric intracellular cation channel family protein [Burkholderia sp. 22PA0099]|uniref:trimeric intracellular cation channel family protein n=1 Tax=Burkholderia sp. 22PA0099 TaxID=3237372 RepID=UPI0039C23500